MDEYIYYNGSKVKNRKGEIFGDYKALDIVGIKNRCAQWECECVKCGDKCVISTKNITNGKFCKKDRNNKNKEEWKQREKRGNKLILEIGKQYDRWTVIEPVEGKAGNFYKCRCEKCGTVREIEAKILNRNTKAYSCKCTKTENGVDPKNDLDLTDSAVFSHKNIKVLNRVGGFGACSVWKCKCLLCGEEWDIAQSSLLSGDVISCGCYKRNLHSKNIAEYVGRVEGTVVSRIKGSKLNKNNTSGVTGVYYNKNTQKWFASIMFKRKTYFLGCYIDKQNAIDTRKNAEKQLYGNFLEWYAREYPKQWERLNKNKDN